MYGKAGALYGEFYVVREDAVALASEYAHGLDDLRPMLHDGKSLNGRTMRLKLFWCSFGADNPSLQKRPALTWSERLCMCRAAFGEASTVRVFLDTKRSIFLFNELYDFFKFGEGVVFMQDGRFYKHKAHRPVNMLLLAVGYTKVSYTLTKAGAAGTSKKAGAAGTYTSLLWPKKAGASDIDLYAVVPTRFYWGIVDPSLSKGQVTRSYAVPFVEDVAYLFDEKRGKQGKMYLNPAHLVKKPPAPGKAWSSHVYEGRNCYFAKRYNALLSLAFSGPVIPHELINSKTVRLEDGRMLFIQKNRDAKFVEGTAHSQRLFVFDSPEVAVVAANEFWMTGQSGKSGEVASAAGVHFQAAGLVASDEFGPEAFKSLLRCDPPKVLTAKCLVKLAMVCSRDLFAHSFEVYGDYYPDLVFGGLCAGSISDDECKSTPSPSSDENETGAAGSEDSAYDSA
jgi:hypothetical protein